MTSELMVKDMNWFFPQEEDTPVFAKFRYRQEDVLVTLKVLKDGLLKVTPEVAQRAITPGQFAVFYHGEELLGGGVIIS
jgi:tRNA-specific 2-thiouridylase